MKSLLGLVFRFLGGSIIGIIVFLPLFIYILADSQPELLTLVVGVLLSMHFYKKKKKNKK